MASPRGPRPRGHERAVGTSERAYRALLRAYPRELRDGYGDEMARCFRDLCREELEGSGDLGLAALWATPCRSCSTPRSRRGAPCWPGMRTEPPSALRL